MIKKLLLKAFREGVGRLIVFVSFLTQGSKVKRTPELQAKVDQETRQLSLYQFYACPFCVKVRRKINQLGLNIEKRDAQNDTPYRQELLAEGGKVKAPCLKIEKDGEVQWLYESNDINAYLEERFANPTQLNA